MHRFHAHALRLVFLFLFCLTPLSVRADAAPLTHRGRPDALFWTVGAATFAADKPMYEAVQRLDSPTTWKAARAVNTLGDGRFQLGLFAIMALAGNGTDEAIVRDGLHALVAGGLVVYALKETTRRARPYAGRGPVFGVDAAIHDPRATQIDPGDANKSFPSGHTMAAFALATVWSDARPGDRELAYALASLVGLSRISLRQHWPSDVFVGAAIGVAAGNAARRDVPFGLMFRVR
jgi:membrane-associated phospholipid phosphatase